MMNECRVLFQQVQLLNKDLQTLGGISKSSFANEPASVLDTFDTLITDTVLNSKVKKLFEDGYHANAVEEAYKYFDNLVLQLSRQQNMTGAPLMKKVLSSKDPILKLNAGISQSEQNEQLGYMEICSGVMTGIRNPRAHDSDWEDTEERALQLLVLANHLVCKIKNSIVQGESEI